MTVRKFAKVGLFATALAFSVLPGCAADESSGPVDDEITNLDGDAPLSDHDSLYDGWPTNDKLASEGKADTNYPVKFTELVALQSPVRSQQRRGVCSIFSGVGLMEHLYVKEGTIAAPDFSEEFLQWSVKTELGRFSSTEGSNSNYNLQAINRFGIVTESDWPYLGRSWDTNDDEACDGDDQPTRCYTHGSPPQTAMEAQRWHLPRGRWVNSSPNSIKAHMVNKKEAVVVGGTFFYQSWNHRSSELSTNNSYWRKGYVTYPNQEDRTKSLEKRAGHSYVLVGWDDDLEVQKRDGEGKLLTDGNGNPINEKGFWLFKNSWGTDSFGVEHEAGAGYGWISMQYVDEFLTAYVSGVPEVDLAEICGNDKDDDFDGDVDCDDSDCGGESACSGGSSIFTNDTATSIPDNDPTGISSDIQVTETGTITALKVNVDISHTYRGDLRVKLVRQGGGEIVLHDRSGSGADNISETYLVADFDGEDMAGTWSLVVSDHAGADVGTLNSWSLEVVTGGEPMTSEYTSSNAVSIPDNDPTGAFDNIEVTDSYDIASLQVQVAIDHSYKGDLEIKLQRLGEPGELVLQQADGSSGAFGSKTYTATDFDGANVKGIWRLTVVDHAAQDVGTLNQWSLVVGR
jgi:subtilisin-like proprotein convertase family protein